MVFFFAGGGFEKQTTKGRAPGISAWASWVRVWVTLGLAGFGELVGVLVWFWLFGVLVLHDDFLSFGFLSPVHGAPEVVRDVPRSQTPVAVVVERVERVRQRAHRLVRAAPPAETCETTAVEKTLLGLVERAKRRANPLLRVHGGVPRLNVRAERVAVDAILARPSGALHHLVDFDARRLVSECRDERALKLERRESDVG